jgi:hypothetical protein
MFTTVEAFDEATTLIRVDLQTVSLAKIASHQKGLWFTFHEYSLISPHQVPA